MKDSVRQIVKTIVEENIVDFKKFTSQTINEKISTRLKHEYAKVAKTILIGESAFVANNLSSNTPQEIATAEYTNNNAVLAPPSDRYPDAPPLPEFPDRSKEPWKSMTNKQFKQAVQDYRTQMRAYQEWYRRQREEELKRIREKVHPAEKHAN